MATGTARVAVVMPAYNEADGIQQFLRELKDAFVAYRTTIIVVDDCSSDNTVELVRELSREHPEIRVVTQGLNRGHGPTTLAALREGLLLSPDVIVASDGDGQISGTDLLGLCNAVVEGEADYVEGVRRARKDPWFRKMVSAITRVMVLSRSGRAPRDANTPFRAYRADRLQTLLSRLPSEASTPNLLISALVRRWGWAIRELEIQSLPRRGISPDGTTWNQKSPRIPSSRFIKFCVRAAREWVTVPSSKAP